MDNVKNAVGFCFFSHHLVFVISSRTEYNLLNGIDDGAYRTRDLLNFRPVCLTLQLDCVRIIKTNLLNKYRNVVYVTYTIAAEYRLCLTY